MGDLCGIVRALKRVTDDKQRQLGGKESPSMRKCASSESRKAAVSLAAGSSEKNASLPLRRPVSILATTIAPSAFEATPRLLPTPVGRHPRHSLSHPYISLHLEYLPSTSFLSLRSSQHSTKLIRIWLFGLLLVHLTPRSQVILSQSISYLPPLHLVCTNPRHHGWSGV